MPAPRSSLAAVAAIVLVGAAALLVVLRDGASGPVPADGTLGVPGASGPIESAASGLPAGGTASAAGSLPADTAPVSPPRIGARPRAAASVPWEEVPQAARMSDLGPGLAAPVNAALAAARDQMESCFAEDTRLQASRPAPPIDPDAPPRGPAVLVLRLESRAGALDVVGTEVDSLGTSTRELVECARHVLTGWPVPAPAATPGLRYRLNWLVQ